MDYQQVFDTLQDYWPGAQEAAVCVLDLTLLEAYTGTTRTIDWDGQPHTLTLGAGIHTGAKVYLPGRGQATPHAAEFCTVVVGDQPPFKRCGDDLHLEFTIDAFTAILGGEVRVPTLLGQAPLTVPPGTAPGSSLRVPGLGMPIDGRPEAHGDLCVHLTVTVPAGATDLERQLIADNAWLRGWRLPNG
jgi:curved DNA-binding protein